MLNPVQKNFRKEMKKLNKEDKNYTNIYRSPRKKSFKKNSFFIIGPIGIILFILTFSGIPTKIINDYQIYKDKKMNNYLHHVMELEQKSRQITNNIISGIHSGELTTENTGLAISEMEVIKNDISNVKAPGGFKEHSKAFETVLDEQLSLIKLIEVSSKTNSLNNNQLQYYVQELNNKNALERKALIAAFESEKIKYEVLSDGSIKYWYKKDVSTD